MSNHTNNIIPEPGYKIEWIFGADRLRSGDVIVLAGTRLTCEIVQQDAGGVTKLAKGLFNADGERIMWATAISHQMYPMQVERPSYDHLFTGGWDVAMPGADQEVSVVRSPDGKEQIISTSPSRADRMARIFAEAVENDFVMPLSKEDAQRLVYGFPPLFSKVIAANINHSHGVDQPLVEMSPASFDVEIEPHDWDAQADKECVPKKSAHVEFNLSSETPPPGWTGLPKHFGQPVGDDPQSDITAAIDKMIAQSHKATKSITTVYGRGGRIVEQVTEYGFEN